MTLIDYIIIGGPIMYAIVFCAVVATFMIIDKWYFFHREQINAGKLINGLTNVIRRNGYTEAVTLCDTQPGPVARILSASLQAYQRGDSEAEIKQVIEDTAMSEMPRLERFMNVLSTIAYVTPLLGLLGTVLGMMSAFDTIALKGNALVVSDLSKAIGLAMITTAGGLAVAIPCYVAYNYLYSRINMFVFEMEKASLEMLAFFKDQRKKQNPS